MPFTPFHMGPGIVVKALLQSSFSLMVFGWAQIIMDIQPLVVLITGEGHLHGFSHTYLGATLLAVFSALSGKHLSQIGLFVIGLNENWRVIISWRVVFLSAFIGTYSHVVLDSIMHSDVQPFWPVTTSNSMLGIISVTTLHRVCMYSAVAGGVIYYAISWLLKLSKHAQPTRDARG